MRTQPIKIDATASARSVGRYLMEVKHTRYEHRFSYRKVGGKYKRYQKVMFIKRRYEIQWKNLWNDVRVWTSPRLIVPQLAYVFAGLLVFYLIGYRSALPILALPIAIDNTTGAEFAAATSYTVSGFTVTGSNTYGIVGVGLRTNTGDVTGVTFNSVSMTELQQYNNNPGTMTIWAFGLAAPTTGNVVITGDTSLAAEVVVSTYTGVAQTGSTGTIATATGTAPNVTVNVTSATGELVVDIVGWRTGGDGTAGAGQTKRSEGVAGAGISMDLATSDEAGAATTTMSWTIDGTTADGWLTIGVPLKPVAAAIFQELFGNTRESAVFRRIKVQAY